MTTLTPRLRIPIPDFNVRPWHGELEETFNRIDAAIYNSVIIGNTSLWGNDVAYIIGDIAIDMDGTYWVCLVDHTSTSAPTTFAAERLSHSTYWISAIVAPANKGTWSTGVSYIVNDYVTHENGFFVCAIAHTSTSSFVNDVANGYWTGLVDLTEIVTTVNFAASSASIAAGRAEGAQKRIGTAVADAEAAAANAVAAAATYDEDQNVLKCLVYT